MALVGCGAIARQFHLPVLAGHPGVRLAAAVDVNLAAASEVAREFGIPAALTDASQLDPSAVDAAIIATPPFHHADCAIGLMRRGIHVFVEKPMATSYVDAAQMVEEAERAGVTLSVGLFRRLYPSLGVFKAALEANYFGRLLSFDLEGGAVYGWQAATLGNMRKELAGGGVLMDMGPHYFDQLVYLFGDSLRVSEYRDNDLGGIESDCLLRLTADYAGKVVEGRIELSRTRKLRNTLRLRCERGVLELDFSSRFLVQAWPDEPNLVDPATGQPRRAAVSIGWDGEPEVDWYESFKLQIDDWLAAIRTGDPPRLSGRSALASQRLIDACYSCRQPLKEPWVRHPLRDVPRVVAEPPRKVLLTGAAGFIGCRVAELLTGRDGYNVRALVRNPANASRLARLPVEMMSGTLTSDTDVAAAVAGCDAVVHCAVGTDYGEPRKVVEVTVGGTRRLAEAAATAGVQRFVHLSSIAVHGNSVAGIIDEATPVQPDRGDAYGESKAAAERAVRMAGGGSLPFVILRPGCVYGPYGATFVTRPIEHLMQGTLILEDSAETPSNTVYVDNVAEAVIRALELDAAPGESFTVCDDDGTTWGAFYDYFAAAVGRSVRREPARADVRPRRTHGPLRGLAVLARSTEFKSFAKRVYAQDPFGTAPRYLIERSPRLERLVRGMFGSGGPTIYRSAESEAKPEVRITPRLGEVRSGKLRRMLGGDMTLTRSEAMRRTLDWLRYSRLLPEDRT